MSESEAIELSEKETQGGEYSALFGERHLIPAPIRTQMFPLAKRKVMGQLPRACKYSKNKNFKEMGRIQFSLEAVTDATVRGCWQWGSTSDE